MAEAGVERRLAAIVIADVVGYSRLIREDEAGTLARFQRLQTTIFQPRIAEYGDRVVKTMGDSYLLEFPSAVAAVECCTAIQKAMSFHEIETPEERRIRFRVGINLGDIVVDGEDIHGDGVNVAARLESMAEPGGILVSNAVYEQVRDKLSAGFEDKGEIEVKNIARPVRVFQVRSTGPAATVPAGEEAAKPRGRIWLAAALAVLLIAVAGGAWWWLLRDAAPVAANPTIAVLPFENLSEDASQAYFAEGMAEDIITDLSKIDGLAVISRTSSFSFKGKAVDIKTIGKALNARYVLEGSVRRAGGQLRINAQLIDAASGGHLWAERYDGDVGKVFAFQDQMTAAIVQALAVTVTKSEGTRLARKRTSNPKAYDFILRGRAALYRFNPKSLSQAVDFYEQAIALDPDYADAHAGHAAAASQIYRYDWATSALSPDAARELAERSMVRALQLDPENASALTTQANMLLRTSGNMKRSIELIRRAIALEPGNYHIRRTLAWRYAQADRPKDALRELDLAMRLAPRPTPGEAALIGDTLYYAGDVPRAVDFLEMARKGMKGVAWIRRKLAAAYFEAGQLAKANAEIQALLGVKKWANRNVRREAMYLNHLASGVRQRYLESLRLAGLPEWPNGYEPDLSQQLDGEAIRKLIFGQTRIGRSNVVGPYVSDIAPNGDFVFRFGKSVVKGRYWLDDDSICYNLPRWYASDRGFCGLILRNPDGNYEKQDEFIHINPNSVGKFSIKR